MKDISKKVLIISICITLVLIICGIILLSSMNKSDGEMASDNKCMSIKTPYGKLKYPEKWDDYLKLEKNENKELYSVKFSCEVNNESVDLFTIYFNSNENKLIGNLEDGTLISASTYDLKSIEKWEENDKNIAYSMQDDMNVIFQNLEKEYGMTYILKGEGKEIVSEEYIDNKFGPISGDKQVVTETSYCTLYYPGRWMDHVKVEETKGDGCSVKYIAVIDKKDYPLFSIHFGKKNGSKLGTYTTTSNTKVEVYIESLDAKNLDKLNSEDKIQYYAMGEDANYIIEKLSEEKGFDIVD